MNHFIYRPHLENCKKQPDIPNFQIYKILQHNASFYHCITGDASEYSKLIIKT